MFLRIPQSPVAALGGVGTLNLCESDFNTQDARVPLFSLKATSCNNCTVALE